MRGRAERARRDGWFASHARIGSSLASFCACASRALLIGVLAWLATTVIEPAAARAECTGEPGADGQSGCVDDAVRDELNARRRYRGVQERVFQKALRHELSAYAGGYAADLTSTSYLVGGAYTFHLSEDLGVEASFGYTRARAELVHIIEARTGTDLVRADSPIYVYGGHLLWTLAYGKLRWFHNRVGRFDFYLALGGGITDNRTARSLTFSAGPGLKFYANSWLGVRFDVRDQLLTQELLGESRIVNNLVATLGVSMFLPLGL